MLDVGKGVGRRDVDGAAVAWDLNHGRIKSQDVVAFLDARLDLFGLDGQRRLPRLIGHRHFVRSPHHLKGNPDADYRQNRSNCHSALSPCRHEKGGKGAGSTGRKTVSRTDNIVDASRRRTPERPHSSSSTQPAAAAKSVRLSRPTPVGPKSLTQEDARGVPPRISDTPDPLFCCCETSLCLFEASYRSPASKETQPAGVLLWFRSGEWRGPVRSVAFFRGRPL